MPPKKKDETLETLETAKEITRETTKRIADVQPITDAQLEGEALVREVGTLRDQMRTLKEREEKLVERLRLELPAGERKLSRRYGEWVVDFTRRTSTRIDYEEYIMDQLGPAAAEEIASIKRGDIESKWAKTSESVSVTVKKLEA